MKMIKKAVTVLLVIAMVLSFAACGNNDGQSGSKGETVKRGDTSANNTTDSASNSNSSSEASNSTTEAKKPIQLTVYTQLANYDGEQVGWSAQVLLEKFNVVLNIIPDRSGVFDTRMEAGNLGDIVVFGATGDDYIRAVENGMLLDWEKYNLLSKYGSYIKDNMKWALQTNRNLNAGILGIEDKNTAPVYGFGHNVATSTENHEDFFYTWDIRWDLYKQLGYPVVKDMNDLITLFKQMKEICPTDENGNPTYALSLWPDWDGNMVMYAKAFATAYYGYDEMALGIYDSDTGAFHDALEKRADGSYGPYLEALQFLNQLYQNDLLDPNSMTQKFDQMSEKLKNGGVFFSIFNYAGSLAYNTPDHLASGKYMYTMVPEQATPLAYGMSVYGGNRVWTIGATTEYPDLCMEIINYLCTPEGRLTMEYGPRGLTWDYDEKGYAYVTEFGYKCLTDGDTPMINEFEGKSFHDGQLQINNTTWSISAVNPDSKVGEKFDWKTWASTLGSVSSEIEKDWVEYTDCVDTQAYLETLNYKVAPATTYTESKKSDELDLIWTQVTTCIVNYSWKAIYAKNDNEFKYFINEMIKKANAYGYEQCLEWSRAEAEKRHKLEVEVRG